jgi:hypothetical protein
VDYSSAVRPVTSEALFFCGEIGRARGSRECEWGVRGRVTRDSDECRVCVFQKKCRKKCVCSCACACGPTTQITVYSSDIAKAQ